MIKNDISYQIERLIAYAVNKGIAEKRDESYIRNILLDMLQINEPCTTVVSEDTPETAAPILSHILDYCAETNLIPQNTTTCRDLMDAKIMNVLMARPSDITEKFAALKKSDAKSASDWFYQLCKDVNYIQVDRINKNQYWKTETDFGSLEITVNLSKPEKDPKEIAAQRNAVQTNYPKCLLCAQNEGFAGHLNHPARQNLRLIPFVLDGENWFFQYSPYLYYNEHCIVLNERHTPMFVSEKTFRRLFDFVDAMPHYFIGSNAGLPIVGGSILSHDHYQGGRHTFPMEKASAYASYHSDSYDSLSISLIKWPMPVIRVSAKKEDRELLIRLSTHIYDTWHEYSDESAGIAAYTGDTPHNAITPIARINKNGDYEIDIVLRNNRTSAEHPLGIFHPHENLHHIKKENIGLIEVMGLAILPGRLQAELLSIGRILTGAEPYDASALNDTSHPLHKHSHWVVDLVRRYGTENESGFTHQLLQDEVGRIFLDVLRDAGVFKFTGEGKRQLDSFMLHCGFRGQPL